jgi:hypothetical protein
MRLTLAFAAILAVVGPVATAQQRPDFSGDWLLVPEASTPSDQLAIGARARLVHKTNELALEMTSFFLAQGASVDSNEFDTPKRYVLDGVEHQMPGGRPTTIYAADQTVRGVLMPRWPTPGRYRATWTGDKLVLFSRDQVPVFSNGSLRWVEATFWTGFSFAKGGTLVVERLDLREPLGGSREQPAPITVRSVYRRAK